MNIEEKLKKENIELFNFSDLNYSQKTWLETFLADQFKIKQKTSCRGCNESMKEDEIFKCMQCKFPVHSHITCTKVTMPEEGKYLCQYCKPHSPVNNNKNPTKINFEEIKKENLSNILPKLKEKKKFRVTCKGLACGLGL